MKHSEAVRSVIPEDVLRNLDNPLRRKWVRIVPCSCCQCVRKRLGMNA